MRRITRPWLSLLVAVGLLVTAAPAGANETVINEYPLGAGSIPTGVTTGFGSVWVTDNDPNNEIVRVDPQTGQVEARFVSPQAGIHAAIATGSPPASDTSGTPTSQ